MMTWHPCRFWPLSKVVSVKVWLGFLFGIGVPQTRKDWTWDKWIIQNQTKRNYTGLFLPLQESAEMFCKWKTMLSTYSYNGLSRPVIGQKEITSRVFWEWFYSLHPIISKRFDHVAKVRFVIQCRSLIQFCLLFTLLPLSSRCFRLVFKRHKRSFSFVIWKTLEALAKLTLISCTEMLLENYLVVYI